MEINFLPNSFSELYTSFSTTLSNSWPGRTVQRLPTSAKWMLPLTILAGVGAYYYFTHKASSSDLSSGIPPADFIPTKVVYPASKAATTARPSQVLYDDYNISKDKPVKLEKNNAISLIESLKENDINPQSAPTLFYPYDATRDRYDNVLQPKATMVPVCGDKGELIPYNGAKFVTENKKVYIFTQQPLETTLQPTQWMTYQHQVSLIIYLDYGNKNIKSCYTADRWELKEIDKKETGHSASCGQPCLSEAARWPTDIKMVVHRNWKFNNLPGDETTKGFVQFVKYCISQQTKDMATLVHCDEGQNRTGLFMATVLMLEELEKNKGNTILNPLELIRWLRRVRPDMVYGSNMLIFCFEVANYLLSDQYVQDFPDSPST